MAMQQSKLAVDTRTFPVLIYDPRKGDKIAQRLSLQGNPSEKTDFFIEPKTNEAFDLLSQATGYRPALVTMIEKEQIKISWHLAAIRLPILHHEGCGQRRVDL
jgi:hypothetical protein